jgi:hypothetical protein
MHTKAVSCQREVTESMYIYIQYPVEIRDVYKIQKPSNPEQNVLYRMIRAHKLYIII